MMPSLLSTMKMTGAPARIDVSISMPLNPKALSPLTLTTGQLRAGQLRADGEGDADAHAAV